MADKTGVSMNTAEHAVLLERVQGRQDLLQQKVDGVMSHVSTTLEEVQREIRRVGDRVSDVATLKSSDDQIRETLLRIETAQREIRTAMDSRLDRVERESEERWLRHEADNENSDRALHDKFDAKTQSLSQGLQSVERRMSRAVGWITAFGATSTLLIGGFLWAIDFRFSVLARNIDHIEVVRDKVHTIELYLARGGRTPEAPKGDK